MFCTSSTSVDAFVEFCRQEAAEIVATSSHVIFALATALVEKRTILTDEIDQIISEAVSAEEFRIDKQRRADWTATIENAKAFHAEISGI